LDCYWSYHFEEKVEAIKLLLLSSEAQTGGNVQDEFNASLRIF